MRKNTFKITIGNTEYSDFITYPIKVLEKNLTESFNTYNVNLDRMETAEPFISNQKVVLTWFENGEEKEVFHAILVADAVEKIGNNNLYKHSLSLIEFTYLLTMISLPDMTTTRIEGKYEPTLYDVANRIIKIMNFSSELEYNYTIDNTTKTILEQIKSPEWTFTRLTAYEALQMVFSYAKIVPKMIDFDTLGHVQVLDDEESIDKLEKFGNETQAFDPQSYRTKIVSNVVNFIPGDDNGATTDPGVGWMTVRSENGLQISADDAMLRTTRPIYKVLDFEVNRFIYIRTYSMKQTGAGNLAVPRDVIPLEWYKPIQKTINGYNQMLVVEKEVYDTLENKQEIFTRGGSFFYNQGERHVKGLTYKAPITNKWVDNKDPQSWRVIMDSIFAERQEKNLSSWIKPEFQTLAEDAALNWYLQQPGNVGTKDLRFQMGPGDDRTRDVGPELFYYVNSGLTIFDLSFKISYLPYSSSDIYTYRERKTNDLELETTQTYNQQATVISSNVLGDLHDRVSNSNTGSQKQLTMLHEGHYDKLKIGARTNDFIITANSLHIPMYGISAQYELSKYHEKLNTYVSVLEKWRQFSIPSEDIVKRQITLNRFAKFSNVPNEKYTIDRPQMYLGESEIQSLKFGHIGSARKAWILNATSYPFNNNLIFEAEMENNSIAGFISDERVSKRNNPREQKAVTYVNELGQFDNIKENEKMSIEFFTDLQNPMTLEESWKLPEKAPINQSTVFMSKRTEHIDKDAREQLAFSLQIHHVDETGKVYINKGFSEINGLVGGIGLNSPDIKIAIFTEKPKNKEKINKSYTREVREANFTMENARNIKLPYTYSLEKEYPAYGLVRDIDENYYEILYWVDEVVLKNKTTKPMYIYFDDKY